MTAASARATFTCNGRECRSRPATIQKGQGSVRERAAPAARTMLAASTCHRPTLVVGVAAIALLLAVLSLHAFDLETSFLFGNDATEQQVAKGESSALNATMAPFAATAPPALYNVNISIFSLAGRPLSALAARQTHVTANGTFQVTLVSAFFIIDHSQVRCNC